LKKRWKHCNTNEFIREVDADLENVEAEHTDKLVACVADKHETLFPRVRMTTEGV